MIEKLKLDSKVAYIVTAAILLLTAVLEIFAYSFGGACSVIASRIWFFEGVLLIGVFVFISFKNLFDDILGRKYALVLCFIALLAILCACLGNVAVSDINPDSCTQLADGVNAFQKPDWNYTGKGFLGYQNRQYLIAAIPTLLFGRSVFSLHLGFGFPFLIGVVLLFSELRRWCAEHFKTNEFFALLPAGSLLIFPFITEYYRDFEQALTPVAFTLIAIALYLKLIRKPDVITAAALAWTGAFLADSYTPGLASWALIICFLILNMTPYFKKMVPEAAETKHKVLFLMVQISAVIHMVIFFIASVAFGRGDRIDSVGEGVSLKEVIKASVDEFINERNVRFLGFFAGAFILYLMFSFLGQLKIYDFILSGWMLGVVVISTYLKGYTDYGKEHLAQRFMIIIPVFVVAGFFVLVRLVVKHNIKLRKRTLAILFAFSLICGIYNLCQRHYSFTYFGGVVPMKYLLPEIKNTLKSQGLTCEDEFNIVIYTDNGLQTNIADYSKYLYPHANCSTYETGENANVPVTGNDKITLIFSEAGYPEGVITDYDIYNVISKKDRMYGMDIYWYQITR